MRLVYLTAVLIALFALFAGCKKEPDAGLLFATEQEYGPPPRHDGAACGSPRLCDGGACLTPLEGWRGGYCTTEDCEGGCNGDDAQCAKFLDGTSLCLDGCESARDCRPGYQCRQLSSSGHKVCYRHTGDGPLAGAIGSDCESDADCKESTCDTSVRGGYCVGDCNKDCRDDLTCASWGGKDRCVSSCKETRDCRVGYVCDDSVCRESAGTPAPFEFGVTEDVLGVTCNATKVGESDVGTSWEVEYTVSAGAPSYTLVPFVRQGTLRPTKIRLPSGGAIDLVTDYVHHNIRATEFQFFDQESEGVFGEVAFDWPIMVPYSPDLVALLESGTHTLEVTSSLEAPCIYVLEGNASAAVLDINVIFAGLEGYNAAMATSDRDLREVFETVDRLFQVANLRVGEVRYYDAPREIAERYAHIRDETDLRRATAFGAPRDQSLRGHLNVDVFLVSRMQLGGGSVLGISAGLPGPPGMHGNPANGLVFTGADLGSDNDFVAHIMAHELGHYLGLRHTTEMVHNLEQGVEVQKILRTTDPIADTPECMSPYLQTGSCPDLFNLMFPVAAQGIGTPNLTAGQGAVLRYNPLFKAE